MELTYVNAYVVTRHYGGPEEGGWYFNAGHPLASIPFPKDTEESVIDEKCKELEEMFAEENEGNIYSVLGGQEVQILLEDKMAEYWPKSVRYE